MAVYAHLAVSNVFDRGQQSRNAIGDAEIAGVEITRVDKAISTPAISTPAFLTLPRFPLPRFQSPHAINWGHISLCCAIPCSLVPRTSLLLCPVGGSCRVLRCACLSVCLSVHTHILETTCPNFTRFFSRASRMLRGVTQPVRMPCVTCVCVCV